MVCVVRVLGDPLYSSLRSVPAKINMETSSTAFWRTRTAFPPKCTWTGFRGDSAEPLVRPAPPCRLCPPSFSGTLPGGPWCWYVGAGASLVGLVCQVGLFCMCYAIRDLLRLCLHILRVFFLFRTCAPETINSPKQLLTVLKCHFRPSTLAAFYQK